MSDAVVVSKQSSITTITLNRPAKLNAIDRAMRALLLEALEDTMRDETCRVVVLAGNGAGFCAGQDLSDVTDGADLGDLLASEYTPIVRLLRTGPKPVIASVHGVAAGAGANLALCCDLVVAADNARFVQAFVKIGLLPDVAGSWLLPRLVGQARARALAMLGQPIDGRQAAEWGMIFRAVPEDRLDAEVEALGTALANAPTQAIALMKRALDASENNALEQQLELESALQSELGYSPDFQEGRRAFMEKRPARFTGRSA